MSVFISKTQEAFGIYGALNDYEIYDNYSVGSNVIVLTYLSRHSVQPLRWRFGFYRPDKTANPHQHTGFDDVDCWTCWINKCLRRLTSSSPGLGNPGP